jgi:uncharacterized delta-60 repeat protein
MIDLATITRDRVAEQLAGPAVSAAPPGHHDKVTHHGLRGRARLGRSAAVAVVALAAVAISTSVAMAATAGDLDPSFDGDGKRVLPYGFTPAEVLATPDGKVVLVDSESSTVVRLGADGSLDRSFGGDGLASADLGVGLASAALQPDGKIVVATDAGPGSIAVARLDQSGSLDATFDPGGPDGDGKKIYTGLQPYTPSAILVQPDGRIVLVGPSTTGITAARLTPSGALDGTTFEYAGDDNADFVEDATLDSDGNIVVAGYSATSGSTDYNLVVARLKPDGKVDKSLAGTGRVELGPPDRDDVAAAVLAQPDGKIVVASESGTGTKHMVVTRLRADGVLDSTFAGDGSTAPDFPGQSYAAGVALQADGKILVAGTTRPDDRFAVARLDSSGALDPGFGVDGKATIAFDGIAVAHGSALQPGGGFFVAGVTLEGQTAVRTALARVLTAAPPVAAGNGGGASGGAGGPTAFGARTLVTLKLAAKRIPAKGPLKVRVTNQNGFAVTGRLSGQTTERVSVTRKRRIKLKTKSFSVASNASRTVKVILPRPLRRLLQRRGKLALRVTANLKDPAGNSRILSKKLTPKLRQRQLH